MIRKLRLLFTALAAVSLFSMCGDDDTNDNSTPPGPDPDPTKSSIVVNSEATINNKGGRLEIPYEIKNPIEGSSVVVKIAPEDSWLTALEPEPDKLLFDVTALNGPAPRTSRVILSYDNADNCEVAITQTPKEIPGGAMTFDINIKEIRSDKVVFDLTPSDPERTFIAHISEKEEIDGITDWDQYFQQKIDFFIEQGMSFGAQTEEEAIKMFLRQGEMKDYEVSLLKPLSDYYIVAYGMNLDQTITSHGITALPFRTNQVEPVDMTFQLKYKDCLGYTRVYVNPSSTRDNFYWSVMKKSKFDAAGETLAEDIVQDLLAQVDNENIWMSEFLFIGDQSRNFKDLTIGEEYVLFAFGCHFKGVITTPVYKMEFTPQAIEKKNCEFQIKKNNTRATYFSVDIVPSDDQVRWFAYTLPHELLDDHYINPEDMTDDALDIAESMGISWTDDKYVHTGRQSLISYQMLAETLMPNTSHFIGVMGINDQGVRVTDLATYKITTLPDNSQPSDMSIDINVEYIDGEVKANFTPNKLELYFYDIQPVEAYDQTCEGNDAIFAENLIFHYNSAGMLNTKLAFIPSYMQTGALEPGHEYYAVAFGYDSGLTTKVFKTRFTYQPTAQNPHSTVHNVYTGTRLPLVSLYEIMRQ